jgi:cell division septation protein DedD
MRFIFFTLLIVNICLAVYVYRSVLLEPNAAILSESVLVSSSSSDGSGLVLLSEVEKKQVVETVRLRARVNAGSQSSSSRLQRIHDKPLNELVAANLCVRVGAFAAMAEARYFVEKLAAQGVPSAVKNVLVSTTVGFWLHLPPLSSKKELRRRLAELQRQGIDSYTIPDGRLTNGISLGMFSEEQRAQSLQKSISRLGYRPEIAKVPREKRELWVFISKGEEQKISDQMWFEWLSAKELPKKQQISCSDVASA